MLFGKKKKAKPGKSLMAFAWYTGGSMSIPVTKFSLRLYGSAKAVEQEQKRHEKAGSCVIHPYSNFRFYWDFISLILLIMTMLTVPVAISFFNQEMTSDAGWIAANLALDMWFFCDIIINFHTGIIEKYGDSEVILDLKVIRGRYLKSWFLIDLVSTVPLDYILQAANGMSPSARASRAMKLFRFAKLLSLLRLLRISRLIRYVHQWEEIVNVQYDFAVAAVRIFNLVCLMLLIGHWNGCLQFLIPMLYDFPDNSWVVLDNLKTAPWGEQYSWALFKAMSHMLCIGYGQKPPQNLMDLWMTMISMVSGAVCFAMFIGHTTALIQSLDSSKRQYKEKYMQVKEYMRYRHLPKHLRLRIYEYYENRFQGKMFNEEGILNEISRNLREEVVNYNCRHLVASVPFFRNADMDFVTEVVQKLKYEVFQPTDVIVKEDTIGKKMYFIQHGVVQISSLKSLQTTDLTDGSYFGEICLLTNKKRVATVKALTNCALYSLHVDDFNDILEEYPIMRRTLETVAASRLNKMGRHNSVLQRRIQQSNQHDSECSGIAEEIVKHDEKVWTNKRTSIQNSTSLSRLFRDDNISSPSRRYLGFAQPKNSPSARWDYERGCPFVVKRKSEDVLLRKLCSDSPTNKGSYSMSDLKMAQESKSRRKLPRFLRNRRGRPRKSQCVLQEVKGQVDEDSSTPLTSGGQISPVKEVTSSVITSSHLASVNDDIVLLNATNEVQDSTDGEYLTLYTDSKEKVDSATSCKRPRNPRSSPDGENSSDEKVNQYFIKYSKQVSDEDDKEMICNGVTSWDVTNDNDVISSSDVKQTILPSRAVDLPRSTALASDHSNSDYAFLSSDRIEVLVENNERTSTDNTPNAKSWNCGVDATVNVGNGHTIAKPQKSINEKCVSTPDVRLWVNTDKQTLALLQSANKCTDKTTGTPNSV